MVGYQSTTDQTKCKKCKDQGGYIVVKEGVEFYKPCECFVESRSERIFASSKITIEFRKKNFSTWDTAWLSDSVRDAHACAMAYSSSFDNIRSSRQNSIALLGQSGSGKTHLLMSIANLLIDKNIPVLYFPYVEGFNEIKDDLDNLETRITKMQKVDVLFIDDLYKGRQQPTAFQIEQTFSVVNYRYMNNLPLLISSERMVEDLIGIDEAIGSRIYEMTRDFRVELSGKNLNYRMRDLNESK